MSAHPQLSLHILFVVGISHPACNCRVSNLCGGGPSEPIVPSRSLALADSWAEIDAVSQSESGSQLVVELGDVRGNARSKTRGQQST